MRVDDREILFIKRNAPVGFPRLIQEKLEADGHVVNRTVIHKEISTLKASYNPLVIVAARELLLAVKGVEYSSIKDEV